MLELVSGLGNSPCEFPLFVCGSFVFIFLLFNNLTSLTNTFVKNKL